MKDLGREFPFDEAARAVHDFAWLAEFRIVDFLTTNYWEVCERIPQEWRQYVEQVLTHESYAERLMELADPGSVVASQNEHPVQSFARRMYGYSLGLASEATYEKPEKQRNVTEKKSYEINVLGATLAEIMKDAGLTRAVDVGIGQGYLAMRLLDGDPDCRIIGIESCDLQVHGALSRLQESLLHASRLAIKQVHLCADKSGREFDRMLFDERNGENNNGDIPADIPDSITVDIPNSIPVDIPDSIPVDIPDSIPVDIPDSIPEYLMYSLHACGPLSEAMVQLFCDPTCGARVLFNVACCYNLIDESLAGVHFPMSAAVRGVWTMVPLTRNVKMVACQAPYRWIHKPRQTRNFLKRHFFRALVELAIVSAHQHRAQDWLGLVGNIGDAKLESFACYAAAAYANMGLEAPPTEYLDALYEQHRHLEKAMAFLWTVRALLGPAVEAIILYDRYQYAKEQLPDSRVALQAVFDPLKSPRNVALIVWRPPTNGNK